MGEVVSLDQVRGQLLGLPFIHPDDPRPRQPLPQEKISAAGDLWLVDSVLGAAEELMSRLLKSERPLEPRDRARLMRASAALLGQPGA
jgi:hypothetical protein